MKPLDFVCIARPKNNRAAYLKCDRPTRARMNAYLFKLYDALGRAESDPFASEDRAFVADLINMQLRGLDWTENDMMMFNARWVRGKRNRLVFNITETTRGGHARYDEVRNINVAAIIKHAAAEYGLVWDTERTVDEMAPEAPEKAVEEVGLVALAHGLADAVKALRAEVSALRAEVASLSAANENDPVDPEDHKTRLTRIVANVNAKIKTKPMGN